MLSLTKLLEDNKLHIFLLGSGGPLNNNKRVSSSIAIIAGGQFLLIDIGPGTYRNADLMRLPVSYLNAIFLTHFHSDHIGDLGEANVMSWANGRSEPLEVYGPKGVEKVVNGFTMAYEFDTNSRIAHHGKELLVPVASKLITKTIVIKNPQENVLCFDKNGMKVFAFEVDHSPVKPAIGYRIEFNGNVVVITGDTIKTEYLIEHCRNADILFCDAISYKILNNLAANTKKLNIPRITKILTDIQEYHMNPTKAAELAQKANVKKLVFVHITPPLLNTTLEEIYLEGVNEVFDGENILGEDRMKFTLNPKLL